MKYSRKIIYFSVYENGAKVRPAGYMAVSSGDGICDVQIVYRGASEEKECLLQPVYMFLDGSVFLGAEFMAEAGGGTAHFRSAAGDFAGSGRSIAELEAVYLDGITGGTCMGRMDGREALEAACTRSEATEETCIKTETTEREEPPFAPCRKKKRNSVPVWLLAALFAGSRKSSGRQG